MRSLILACSVALFALSLGACDAFTGPGDGELTVVEVTPSLGSGSVDVLAEVRLTFSQDLLAVSVPGAVTLHAGSRQLRGTLSPDGDRVLVFVPGSPLDFGTEYRIDVAPTLASSEGTPMSEAFSSAFRTLGTAPPRPDTDQLRALLSVLAHDSLGGRGSGTADEERAADYIQSLFTAYGLEAPAGGFLQEFEATSWSDQSLVTSQNVLGAVPGTGALAEEWIVVGAHYDHVGLRLASSGSLEIHNGADDNASGTATVVELARLFSAYVQGGGTADQPRRSVLFAAWGAEEKGLLGSCSFTQSGLVPMNTITATLNFDMVGRLRNNLVQAHGPKSSDRLPDFLSDSNQSGLSVASDPNISCASCSDHACFRDAGVPYVWFFTGTHDQYHRPSDDNHLIDFNGTASIGEVAFRLLTRLAVTPQALAFTPDP